MGLLRFTPAGWAKVRLHLDRLEPAKRERLDMTSLLRGLLQSGCQIGTVVISEQWFEVDSARDLQVAESAILHLDR